MDTIKCQFTFKMSLKTSRQRSSFLHGLFESLWMPYWGGADVQRLMDSVLRDMPFLFIYLDDILVAGAKADEYLTHLRLLFQRLSEHGRTSIDFLSHHVTPQGAIPLPARVDAVARFPRPGGLPK